MKIDAVVRALTERGGFEVSIVHTGQHYDPALSKALFDDLGLPRPDVNLEVGSASHAAQTAAIIQAFEPVIHELTPDLVVVVGDVNSTVACGLVAVKLGIPLAHVEAGLRSGDRGMPEEINRVVTDSISDLLFVSEPSGVENLRREGVPEGNVFAVGNVMIDTLLRHRQRSRESKVMEFHSLTAGEYAVLTLHRPSNVDRPEKLAAYLDALGEIAQKVRIVFPAHPRTRARLRDFGLLAKLEGLPGVELLDPLGYLDFLRLMSDARLLLTDSGGIQEEATILGVPCLTLRSNTERPATVEYGGNRIIGDDPSKLLVWVETVLAEKGTRADAPPGWDGRAGKRIAETLASLGTEGLARLQRERSGVPEA